MFLFECIPQQQVLNIEMVGHSAIISPLQVRETLLYSIQIIPTSTVGKPVCTIENQHFGMSTKIQYNGGHR